MKIGKKRQDNSAWDFRVPFWRKLLATVLFWVISQVGGAVVFAWNAFMPEYAQLRSSFGQSVLQAVSGPVGFYLAVLTADALTYEECPVLAIVNSSIFAILSGISTWLYLASGNKFSASDLSVILSALSSVAYIIYVIHQCVKQRKRINAKPEP